MPAVALDHPRCQRPGERDRGAQIDLEHAVDLRLGQLGQEARGGQRGVRDQHVDPAGLVDQPRHVLPAR